MDQMMPISTTTSAMRIAKYVKGSALLTTYLVPMKPVLHSRTKIAGAARAASLSKSAVICRPCCPIVCYAASTDRAGRPARFYISKAAIAVLKRGTRWMFAPRLGPVDRDRRGDVLGRYTHRRPEGSGTFRRPSPLRRSNGEMNRCDGEFSSRCFGQV